MMKKLIAILCALLVLGGCSSTPKTDNPNTGETKSNKLVLYTPTAQAAGTASGPVTAPETFMPIPMETAYATTTAREHAVWAAPM